ncbi:menaquinone biosynthetic enzyme MqnA/MqnD family protein [Bacteroidota bacterium]
MVEKIKVSAVSYVNSYPFIYGLQHHPVSSQIELELDTPAACGHKLLSGQVDIGLVPVALISELKNPIILGDKCIGSEGPVETVCLFSDVPLNEIEEVLLDNESKTSVQLVQVLAEKHWKISPKWIAAKSGFINRINGKTAGVVIGDRAFALRDKHPFVYDLSEAWKSLTGLPFVFACWVSNKELPEDFLAAFNESLQFGLDERETAIELMAEKNTKEMKRYVTDVISYELDPKKHEAMKLFARWLCKAV